MQKILIFLFFFPLTVMGADNQLILGAGYNDDPSCFYKYVTKKKADEPWKLIADDLIEVTALWECSSIKDTSNQKSKIQGSRTIQMSCEKEQYMILDEYGKNHSWEFTNPEYKQVIVSFKKARYISPKGLDSLIKLYCKN